MKKISCIGLKRRIVKRFNWRTVQRPDSSGRSAAAPEAAWFINPLLDAFLTRSRSSQHVLKVLKEMVRYAGSHFMTEQNLMIEFNDPESATAKSTSCSWISPWLF